MLRVLDAWRFQKGQSRSEWDEEIMKVKLMTVIPVQVQNTVHIMPFMVRVSVLDR